MHFTIEKKDFLKALSHGQGVVERRVTIPILAHVLVEAREDGIYLTSTDMDLCLVECMPGTVIQAGSATLPAHTLYDIVRKTSDRNTITVKLNPSNAQVQILSGPSRFNLASLPAEDFPKLSAGTYTHTFKLPTQSLCYLIDQSSFAIASESSRQFLNGIYMHVVHHDSKIGLRSVATDGLRLACIEIPAPENAQTIPGVILGRKTITEIRKLLGDSDAELTVHLSDKRVLFELPTASLGSRLLEGIYPDYQDAIAIHEIQPIVVKTKDFASAIDRVATVVSDLDRIIQLEIQPQSMILSAASHELGSATEELDIDNEPQKSLKVGFNAKYLLEVMQKIAHEETEIFLEDSTEAAAVLRSPMTPDDIFLVMPMRI